MRIRSNVDSVQEEGKNVVCFEWEKEIGTEKVSIIYGENEKEKYFVFITIALKIFKKMAYNGNIVN